MVPLSAACSTMQSLEGSLGRATSAAIMVRCSSSIVWNANLRILDVTEIKTVPEVPLSHPFIERLVGTMRRELLDQVPFWSAGNLERKLLHFRDYYNRDRVHASLGGATPACKTAADMSRRVISLSEYQWQSLCGGL